MLEEFKIPVIKSMIEETMKDLIKSKLQLENPKYNHFLVQSSISQQTGYLSGLKVTLEELESILKVVS